MKPTIVSSVTSLVLLSAISFGGYRYYDSHHISSDLKTTIKAALDPTASENDFSSYVRAARLQVRTAKDRQEMDRIQRLLVIGANRTSSYDRTAEQLSRQDRESDLYNKYQSVVKLEEGYRLHNQPVPPNIHDELDSRKSEWKNAEEQARKADEWLENRDKKEDLELKETLTALCSDFAVPCPTAMKKPR